MFEASEWGLMSDGAGLRARMTNWQPIKRWGPAVAELGLTWPPFKLHELGRSAGRAAHGSSHIDGPVIIAVVVAIFTPLSIVKDAIWACAGP